MMHNEKNHKNKTADDLHNCITEPESGNGGFSLVELIVSMLVSMIVMSAVVMFITTAMNFYRSSNEEIKLQMESQIAMNLIADIVIETNSVIVMNPVVVDAVSYPVLDVSTSEYDSLNAKTVNYHHIIVYDSSTGKLLYYKYTDDGSSYILSDIIRDNMLGTDNLKKVFLANYVTGFSVVQSGDLIQVTIDFANGSKTYHASQSVNMRNSDN